MKIQLIAVGTKMPSWVDQGYQEYARRFSKDMPLELKQVAAGKRGKNAVISKILADERKAMLDAVGKGDRIVALAVDGKPWSTPQLAQQMTKWQHDGRNVSLLIGGPEGMDSQLLQRAEQRWSLSALTLPHPMVRVVVAEALYRAWSLNNNHPYHRE